MHHITGIQQNDGPFPLWLTLASFLRELSWAHTDNGLRRGGRFPIQSPRSRETQRKVVMGIQLGAGSRRSGQRAAWEGGSTGKTDFKSGKANLELRLE